jgi:hypothetical protein
MKRNHLVVFLIWAALLNWPPLLVRIPALQILCFLPCLFWINIPALWLGLAKLIGQPNYEVQEFGALPQTPLAWSVIVVFWLLVATGAYRLDSIIAEIPPPRRGMRLKTSNAS